MHFNGTILDLFKKFDSFNFEDINLIDCKDPFWTKLINSKLRDKYENFASRWSEDLSVEWVNETWYDLSLFANTDIYFLYNTESASADVINRLATLESPSEKIFIHYAKEPKKFLKSFKTEPLKFKIKPFNFWELDKVLDFYSLILEERFSPAIKQYFSNWTIEQKREIYDQLKYLKLIYEDLSSVTLTQMTEVLSTGDLNPFVLTDYLTQKKEKNLYEDILQNLKNDNWASSHKAVTFLRSFIIKSADPAYKDKKPKLNSFDRKILTVQGHYSQRELSAFLKDISNWEILIKRKDKGLIQNLQSKITALS